jgi:hypothetical protein
LSVIAFPRLAVVLLARGAKERIPSGLCADDGLDIGECPPAKLGPEAEDQPRPSL